MQGIVDHKKSVVVVVVAAKQIFPGVSPPTGHPRPSRQHLRPFFILGHFDDVGRVGGPKDWRGRYCGPRCDGCDVHASGGCCADTSTIGSIIQPDEGCCRLYYNHSDSII